MHQHSQRPVSTPGQRVTEQSIGAGVLRQGCRGRASGHRPAGATDHAPGRLLPASPAGKVVDAVAVHRVVLARCPVHPVMVSPYISCGRTVEGVSGLKPPTTAVSSRSLRGAYAWNISLSCVVSPVEAETGVGGHAESRHSGAASCYRLSFPICHVLLSNPSIRGPRLIM